MADSFTLDDFTAPGWIDRPEYRQYQGISISHVRELHREAGYLCDVVEFGGLGQTDHTAFIHLKVGFTIYIYEVVSWGQIRTVSPAFIVLGKTYEGATEVQSCPDSAPLPSGIIEQMRWVTSYIEDRGWTDA